MTKALTAQDLADTFDASNRHDIDAVMTHFAPDCVFYTVGGDAKYGTKTKAPRPSPRPSRRSGAA